MGLRERVRGWLGGVKESQAWRAIFLLSQGQATWWDNSRYDLLVKEGFEKDITVYAAIMEVAHGVSGLRWQLFTKGKKGRREEVLGHPMLQLLRRPNPLQGQSEFFEFLVGYLLISGNSYVEAAGPEGKPPMELWPLRPDRMKVLPHPRLMVGGYRHAVGGVNQDFEPASVLHMRLFSAMNDYYGTSPLAIASRAVDIDVEGMNFTKSLLANAACPASSFSTEGALTPDQREYLKTQITEQYIGAKNAGRPLILEGGLSFTPIAWNPKDTGLLEWRKLSKLEICQAFQVPPELLGDQANKTYANYAEARKAFYMETVLPLADRVRDALQRWLVPAFDATLELDYNRDAVEAIKEDRLALWGQLTASTWLTINEKRKQAGFDEVPTGDVILVPGGMIPLETAIDAEAWPADDPTAPPDDDDEEEAGAQNGNAGRVGGKNRHRPAHRRVETP